MQYALVVSIRFLLLTVQSLRERLSARRRGVLRRRPLEPRLEEGRRVGVLPVAAGDDRVGAAVRGGGGAIVGLLGLLGRVGAACPGGGRGSGGGDLVALVGERVLLHVSLQWRRIGLVMVGSLVVGQRVLVHVALTGSK